MACPCSKYPNAGTPIRGALTAFSSHFQGTVAVLVGTLGEHGDQADIGVQRGYPLDRIGKMKSSNGAMFPWVHSREMAKVEVGGRRHVDVQTLAPPHDGYAGVRRLNG
jgi:hypothetical protein